MVKIACKSAYFIGQSGLLLLLALALPSPKVVADEYPYLYRSAYFLGRGDTGIAIAEEEEAIFYNPAGLAVGKGIYKQAILAAPMVEFSRSARDIAKQIALQESDPTQTLRKQIGNPQHVGLNHFSGLILRRAALGVFAHHSTTLMLYKDPEKGALETVSAHSVTDLGLTFSLAHTIFRENLHAGFTVKYLKRSQAAFVANATETETVQDLKTDDLMMMGTGTGIDLGLMYRGEGRTPLSFGLTLQDIGNTTFDPDQATTLSEEERPLKDLAQTLNLGFAIEPGTRYSKFRILADIRDVLDQTKQNLYKKMHFGAELTFRNFIGFTAGLGQGYPSFGTYVDLRVIRMDLGAYTEEVGENAGSRPDERYYFKIAVGL